MWHSLDDNTKSVFKLSRKYVFLIFPLLNVTFFAYFLVEILYQSKQSGGINMTALFKKIRIFFGGRKTRTYIRRKSQIIAGRALRKLDKYEIMGDNIPSSVLEYFGSTHGVMK